MSTTEIVNLVVTIVVAAPVASILAQIIRRSSWPSGLTFAVVSLVCVAVGVAQTWIAGELLGLISDWGDLTAAQALAWVGAVWAGALGEYEMFFKGLPWFGTLLRLGGGEAA